MSKGTTRRSIRIDDDLWDKAQGKAEGRGDNLSAVIRDGLLTYIQEEDDERTQHEQELGS